MCPSEDPINAQRGVPPEFETFNPPDPMLVRDFYEITQTELHSKNLRSASVAATASAGDPCVASVSMGLRYRCSQESGALLMLKEPGHKKSLHCDMHIRRYISTHLASWCAFANGHLGIGLEDKDLIFVSGFIKTSAWAIAAFHNSNTSGELIVAGDAFASSVSGEFRVSMSKGVNPSVFSRVGPMYRTSAPRPSAPVFLSHLDRSSAEDVTHGLNQEPRDQCIFLNYYKMRSRMFRRPAIMRAAAGPHGLPRDDGGDHGGRPSSATLGSVSMDSLCDVFRQCEPEDYPEDQSTISPSTSLGGESLYNSSEEEYDEFKQCYDPVDTLLDYLLKYGDRDIACVSYSDIFSLFQDDGLPRDVVSALEMLRPTVFNDADFAMIDNGARRGSSNVFESPCTTISHMSAAQDEWDSNHSPSESQDAIGSDPPFMPTAPLIGEPLYPPGYTGCNSTDFDDESSHLSPQHLTSVNTLCELPSQFLDPYLYRSLSRWHAGTSTPALSYADSSDSSAASTRSSAYTQSQDYGHVHVGLGDDESGITSDDVIQLLSRESGATAITAQGRTFIDQTGRSDIYGNDHRPRLDSLYYSKWESEVQDKVLPSVWEEPSNIDTEGQVSEGHHEIEMRREVGSNEASFDGIKDELEDDEQAKEGPTNAATSAEEGSAIIVRGNDVPIVRLQVAPGTTHLLVGSSPTPDAVPSFLATTLSRIASSLLALDISANCLCTLPSILSACINLEELNIASNPLGALPTVLTTLTSLRVLIADSTGISTLPANLASLENLRTLSIRMNKMHSLPSWLCVLPVLETLLVDGNPFAGPWESLVEGLLYREPSPPSCRSSLSFSANTYEENRAQDSPSPSDTTTTDTSRASKYRNFLPIHMSPVSPHLGPGVAATNASSDGITHAEGLHREEQALEARIRALRTVTSYLRDMHDLDQTQSQTISSYSRSPASAGSSSPSPESVNLRSPEGHGHRSTLADNVVTMDSTASSVAEKEIHKDDKATRTRVIREIVETERTYVKSLQELVDIYIKPASATVHSLSLIGQTKDTVVPSQERNIVFGGLEALFVFHQHSFLPALEKVSAPLFGPNPDDEGHLSLNVARDVANTFVSHAAYMRIYSTYIDNFANSLQRIKMWTLSPSSSSAGPSLITTSGLGNVGPQDQASPARSVTLTSSQRKRIKAYLKRCRLNPRHSQLNLEGYLLLPVGRIPRYRLLLEQLAHSSPPMYGAADDPIDRALTEIGLLAMTMNESKHEHESRRRLVQWQSRIRGNFPSPLVQPHRRFILDGPLKLERVVRKATVAFEVTDAHGETSTVDVECLSPELIPRSLIGILCNDLLVLCKPPSEDQDSNCSVDLWAVLRIQTFPQVASIVHGNTLRLVDNKAILYLDAPSTSDALMWSRAINVHIPTSRPY
ncbi:hypothetical protein C8Q80DRAFT_1205847 [Daedaleopsis nitida]|nr:hypothetical protein C8Q80DRAFT_1205847 [Daedaleopsis nitida]